jgi:hypothetical protein
MQLQLFFLVFFHPHQSVVYLNAQCEPTAEVTFGGGVNACGGISITIFALHRHCTNNASRP